ncbi:MAG: CHAT domain-containing protein [Vicinamibacterales bacterium]
MGLRRLPAALLMSVATLCWSACAPSETAESLHDSAVRAFRDGALDAALATADRGLALADGEDATEGALQLLRAEILLQRPDPDLASVALETARVNSPRLRARREYLRARLLALRRAFDEAALALDEASTLAEAAGTGTDDVAVDIRTLQGEILFRLRRPAEAEAALVEGRAIAERSGYEFGLAGTLMNLGMVRTARGRFDEALPYFERVLAMDALGSTTRYAAALSNAAMSYARLGEFTRAVAAQERAVQLHERGQARRFLEQALGELGSTHLLRGSYDEGIPYLQRALDMATGETPSPDAALWAGNLASAYIELEQWDEAERHTREMERLAGTPRTEPLRILNLAKIAEGRGQDEAAARLYTDSLEAGRDDPAAQWPAEAGLGRLAFRGGRTADANRHFERALDVIERTRSDLLQTDYRVSLLTRLIRFYREYVDVLLEQGRVEQALLVTDSSRARVLAERHGMATPGRVTAVDVRRAARRLDAVIVSYWLGPERSLVWVTDAAGVHVEVLPGAPVIEALVEAHQDQLVTTLADVARVPNSPGEQLYAAVVAPIAKWLPRADVRLVIVGDGALNRLNFETLPVPGPEPRYFIEDALIARAPSLAVLAGPAADRGERGRGERVLLVGDAEAVDPAFPALQFASAEISAISRLYADAATVVRGPAASPAAYLAAGAEMYDIIHFAAHATANLESPLDSAVVLSQGASGYKLYARDIAEQQLSANLVTVSACRSAGERTYSGEGLVGFAWAFMRAGARRVVAGLWDVDDRSTAQLMGDMYTQLAAGDTPAVALRDAKLAMLARGGVTAKPYYWGPFELFIGASVTP